MHFFTFAFSIFPANITGVKQCIFQWLISNDIAQNETVFNGLIIHHLIMIICISYEITFTIYLPKFINIAPLQSCTIWVFESIRHCNTDDSGLEWSILINLCTDAVSIFLYYLMQVIMIEWWILKLLKLFVSVLVHWKSINEMYIASPLWIWGFKIEGLVSIYLRFQWIDWSVSINCSLNITISWFFDLMLF